MPNNLALSLPPTAAHGSEQGSHLADPFPISGTLFEALARAFEIHSQDPEFQREWRRTNGLQDHSSFDVISEMVWSVWRDHSGPKSKLRPEDHEAMELAASVINVFYEAIDWIQESREEGRL